MMLKRVQDKNRVPRGWYNKHTGFLLAIWADYLLQCGA